MSTLPYKRKTDKPKFNSPDLSGKMAFRVNARTQVYVDKNSTPEQLEAIKAKHNSLNIEGAIIKRT